MTYAATNTFKMIDELQQRHIALELVQALVFRQDERVSDLCQQQLDYAAFVSPERLPSLDDLADSPTMRMKQLVGLSEDDRKAHGWSPIARTTLDRLLEARQKAYGTAIMCQQRIMGIMQRENVCAVRFQEINRTGALDKTSVMRLHFKGEKVDAIDEYIDARRSFGFERAVGAEEEPLTPLSPDSCFSV